MTLQTLEWTHACQKLAITWVQQRGKTALFISSWCFFGRDIHCILNWFTQKLCYRDWSNFDVNTLYLRIVDIPVWRAHPCWHSFNNSSWQVACPTDVTNMYIKKQQVCWVFNYIHFIQHTPYPSSKREHLKKTWISQTTHQLFNKFVSMEYCSEASLGEGFLLSQGAQVGGSVGHGSQPDDQSQRRLNIHGIP